LKFQKDGISRSVLKAGLRYRNGKKMRMFWGGSCLCYLSFAWSCRTHQHETMAYNCCLK